MHTSAEIGAGGTVVTGQIETASQSGDLRVLRSLLLPRFITKIKMGYGRARL